MLTLGRSEWEEVEEHIQDRLYAAAVQVFPGEAPDPGKCRLCTSLVTWLCGGWVIKGTLCHLGTGCRGLSSLMVRVHSKTFHRRAWHGHLEALSPRLGSSDQQSTEDTARATMA